MSPPLAFYPEICLRKFDLFHMFTCSQKIILIFSFQLLVLAQNNHQTQRAWRAGNPFIKGTCCFGVHPRGFTCGESSAWFPGEDTRGCSPSSCQPEQKQLKGSALKERPTFNMCPSGRFVCVEFPFCHCSYSMFPVPHCTTSAMLVLWIHCNVVDS